MRVIALIVGCFSIAAMLSGCLDSTDTYCEVFERDGRHTILAVPSDYYALAHTENSGSFSLYFRYSDLEPKEGREDYSELSNPAWSIETSNLTALVRLQRHPPYWAMSLEDVIGRGHKKAREVPTDWEGWKKIEQCANCSERLYFNEAWQARGVANVGRYEVKGRDPIYLGCSANDIIDGLWVTYHFPVMKRQHLEEFRSRTTGFIRKLAADAEHQCVGQ